MPDVIAIDVPHAASLRVDLGDFEDAGLYLATGSTERDESRGATVETAKEREMCHSDTHGLNNAQTYRFLLLIRRVLSGASDADEEHPSH
jgi:hypothetical protein